MKPIRTAEELLRFVRESLNEEVERTNDRLLDEALLSSLDLIELVDHIEAAFGLELEPEQVSYENFQTIDSIAVLIKSTR